MITDTNPFVYSRPVSPEEIVDRDEEAHELLAKAVGGHYVRLYGPRKYGKTSLLRRALADGEKEEGLIPILVDLYGIVSLGDVAVRFERAYSKQLKGPIRRTVEELLAALRPQERAVVLLHYQHGQSHSEIAEAVQLPMGTVKTQPAWETTFSSIIVLPKSSTP